MRKISKQYPLVFVGAGFTIIFYVIGWLLRLDPGLQWVLFSLGVMISIAMGTIEHEVREAVKSLLDERLKELRLGLELYDLLLSIDDKDLQSEVIKLARSLRSGEIPPGLAEFRMRTLSRKTKSSLWGS